MCVCSACVHVCIPCVSCLQGLEEDTEFLKLELQMIVSCLELNCAEEITYSKTRCFVKVSQAKNRASVGLYQVEKNMKLIATERSRVVGKSKALDFSKLMKI